jgi:hypothetical protein
MTLAPEDARLLAAFLARQREEGAAAELPSERLRALAAGRGAPLAVREAAALLASPVAREELALHLRLEPLRRATAANDARRVFRIPAEERLAAADADAALEGEAFRLECGDAELWVVPGYTASARFLLTLRLLPETQGGIAERTVEVREDGPDGLVWLAGRTDENGAIHQVWAHEDTTPHARGGPRALLRLSVLD